MAVEFDALVIGSGIAASAAAATMATHGLRVGIQLSASGPAPTGGVVSGRALARGPEWARSLPVDRRLAERRILLLDRESTVSLDYQDWGWPGMEDRDALVDGSRWCEAILGVAQRAGARLLAPSTEPTVEAAGPRTMPRPEGSSARVTVYATAAPGRSGRGAADWTTLRRTFSISPDRIEGRLGLAPETGAFLECVLGFLPATITGAGYLYPTRDALVAGVVVATPLSAGGPDAARTALNALCAHAAIAPLLAPGSASEEVGAPACVGSSPGPPDSGEEYLSLGAPPGASYSTVAGAPSADRELARGVAAGEVVVGALRGGGPTATALGRFLPRLRALERSWAGASHGIALDPRSGGEYPRLAAAALHELLNESGRPKESIATALQRVRRAARLSWYRLGVDALAVGRAL